MLDALQRSVALKACRAYRTPPFRADPREVAPDIRVREAVRLYEVKRGSESGTSVPTGSSRARGLPRNAASRALPNSGSRALKTWIHQQSTVSHCRAAHIYRRQDVRAAQGDREVKEGRIGWSTSSATQSSLQMLTAPKTYNPLAHAARQDIRDIVAEGREVRLFWVRAHAEPRATSVLMSSPGTPP
ncbi:hypothetical protein EVAR_71954_1 [Eumeta japonica]|uniref:Uncharacterized protein n=1 Tax=Eumeta variegata TaxID=151549 RepID=A0A4C1SX36_EUMVA|nr:hypothetical protein EVAR_71954_1 [Eumeta japonica]